MRKDLALGIFSETQGREELRAIGRYYLDDDGLKADVAFVVHETNRHMGMAGYLLGELAEVAKRREVAGFWASVLPDNRAMAGLFHAAGRTESKGSMDEERSFEMAVGKIPRSRKKFLERKKIERVKR